MQSHDDIARAIARAGAELIAGRPKEGEELIRKNAPHVVRARTRRSAGDRLKLKVWIADGFRCRYNDELLFFASLSDLPLGNLAGNISSPSER